MFETEGNLASHISTALSSTGYQTLIQAGGGILLFGFLLSLLLEWIKFHKGDKADWAGPIVNVVMVSLGLAMFPFIIQIVVSGLGIFGDLEQGTQTASQVFQQRMDRFFDEVKNEDQERSNIISNKFKYKNKTTFYDEKFRIERDSKEARAAREIAHQKSQENEEKNKKTNGWGFSGVLGSIFKQVQSEILFWITILLKYFTIALVISLKVIQALLLKILVFLGPVMIAFGAVPGPFRQFPMNWFMLFFTVSFWSVVMNALLYMLAESTREVTTGAVNFSEEIIISFVWIFLIMAVPLLSTALIYGSGFSGVFSEATSGAAGFIASKGTSAINILKKVKG
jgi:hypothetical protein